MRFDDGQLIVTDSEVWQARLGFEAAGTQVLSDRLEGSAEFDWDSKEAGVDDNTARLVLAGNLALVGSLKTFGPMHPNADGLRDGARKAVDSAIEAIAESERDALQQV